MLPILTVALLVEAALALLLVSRVKPLVRLACMVVDITKTSKGSAVTKTLAGTLFVLLASSITTYVKARQHLLSHHGSEVHGSPAEFFVLRTAELESALSGFILLLALMINRFHYYYRKAQNLQLNVKMLKKQSEGAQSEYQRLQQEQMGRATEQDFDELKGLKDIVGEMKKKVEEMQVESHSLEKRANAAEANVEALRKQTEGMGQEYDRLLDDNENLRMQLAAFDREHSRSDSKKKT